MTPAEEELRHRIDARVNAVRAKDVDAVLSAYASTVVTFDVVPPLVHRGRDEVRTRLRDWYASFEGPIDYEVRDVVIAVSGDAAFDHHVTHVRGTSTKGARIAMWFRETVGYAKVDGHWWVTHQHSSVPFDPTTGMARLDLQP